MTRCQPLKAPAPPLCPHLDGSPLAASRVMHEGRDVNVDLESTGGPMCKQPAWSKAGVHPLIIVLQPRNKPSFNQEAGSSVRLIPHGTSIPGCPVASERAAAHGEIGRQQKEGTSIQAAVVGEGGVVVVLYTSDARPQWAAFMQSSPGAAPGAHRARQTRAKGGPCRIRTLRAVKPTGHPQAGVLSRRRA